MIREKYKYKLTIVLRLDKIVDKRFTLITYYTFVTHENDFFDKLKPQAVTECVRVLVYG